MMYVLFFVPSWEPKKTYPLTLGVKNKIRNFPEKWLGYGSQWTNYCSCGSCHCLENSTVATFISNELEASKTSKNSPLPRKMGMFSSLVGFDHCSPHQNRPEPKFLVWRASSGQRLLDLFGWPSWKGRVFFWFPRKPLPKGCFHTWKREDLGWCRIFKWILGGPLPFWGSPCWFYYSSFYDTKKSVFGKRFLGGQNDRHKLSTGSFLVASSSLGVWDFNVGRRLALSFFFLKELSDEEKSDVFLPVSIN